MMLQIRDAASYLGVCNKTLRRWESRGYILPQRTQGTMRSPSPQNFLYQKKLFYSGNTMSSGESGFQGGKCSAQKYGEKMGLFPGREYYLSRYSRNNLVLKNIGS